MSMTKEVYDPTKKILLRNFDNQGMALEVSTKKGNKIIVYYGIRDLRVDFFQQLEPVHAGGN